MEHLRHVAGARGADPAALAAETAVALARLCDDAGALVVTARRMVEHQPDAAPLWWACATIVTAIDPCGRCSEVLDLLRDDDTVVALAGALSGAAVVCTIGWSGHLVEALAARDAGDDGPEVLVVDCDGDGRATLRMLERAGVTGVLVAPEGAGEAARCSDAVVVPVLAAGPDEVLAPGGALALAATAYVSEVPVWAVTPRGTRLPRPLWDAVADVMRGHREPWANGVDLVGRQLLSHVAGPDGAGSVAARPALFDAECPHAPELLRRSAL